MQDQISRNLCQKFFHSSRPALNYPSLKDAVTYSETFLKIHQPHTWFAHWFSQLSDKPLRNIAEATDELKLVKMPPGELDEQEFRQKLLTAWIHTKL